MISTEEQQVEEKTPPTWLVYIRSTVAQPCQQRQLVSQMGILSNHNELSMLALPVLAELA
jgi:hypothetical protein